MLPDTMPQRDPSLGALLSAAYDELRRLAHQMRRHERDGHILNTTALVHEAFEKLAASPRLTPESKQHLKGLMARAMRQVLVEAARKRKALKRGRDYIFVTFDDERDGLRVRTEDLLALDEALENLARMDPRQAKVIEYRFFGGYSVQETAALLGISESTITRDWRAARAWLLAQLQQTG